MTKIRLHPTNSYVEDGRPWYDTKEGIRDAVKTLSDFLKLAHKRHQAGYCIGKDLNQLYVFGDYSFDTSGNCLVAEPSVKKLFPDIPDILTHDEYFAFLKERNGENESTSVSFSYNMHIPNEHVLCPVCASGWNLSNMRDVTTLINYKGFDVSSHAGISFRRLKEIYSKKTDAEYYIGTEHFLQNDRFIDLSPWTDNPTSDLEAKMVKNEGGRVGYKNGIDDRYVICDGDKVTFAVVHYYHTKCRRQEVGNGVSAEFKEVFTKAGFKMCVLSAIRNEYCNCNNCAPWYEVDTEIGKFKIGWRKRVINIDWNKLGLDKKVVTDLFSSEEVTKGPDFIHAWSYESASFYLAKILGLYKS